MISLIPEPYRTALAFVAVLGMLIFFHELGHLLAARWRGVRVDRFAIGFGHPIAKWTDRRGTEWFVGWVPLGGYVRLHGQYGEPKKNVHVGQTYHDKPVLDRAIIVAAGPVANFLLAAILFMGIFAFNGKPYMEPVVTTVIDGSPALSAGIRVGDRILAIDGVPLEHLEKFQKIIRQHPGIPMTVLVQRGDDRVSLMATPESRPVAGRANAGWLGMTGGVLAWEQMTPIHALAQGVAFTAESTWHVVSAVGELVTGNRSATELGGPVRIAQMSGEVVSNGMLALLGFIAFMSVNLAVMNLMPIPGLDGGYLMFYAIEAVMGKPLSPRVADFGFRIGMAGLFSFMMWTTFNDFVSLGAFDWLP